MEQLVQTVGRGVCTMLSSFSTVCQAGQAEMVIGYCSLGLLVLLGGMAFLFRDRS